MNDYFLIHKPYQVLSQFSPSEGKLTLADCFDVPKNVYPVGRLDHDSEGLLLLTNDRKLNHRLLNPAFAHQREYWVQVDGAIDAAALRALQSGVTITVDGKQWPAKAVAATLFETEPAVAERDPPIRFRKEIPAPWIRMVLTEGKNRQVRKMTAAAGFPTLRLIRYRIEQLSLGNLPPGGIIRLSKKTVYNKLFHEHID